MRFPAGVYPVEPMEPVQGFAQVFEPADGDDDAGEWEEWPDRYVYDVVISADRLPTLVRSLLGIFPPRVYPILDVIGHDAYREIDPFISYELIGLDRMLDALRSYADYFFEDGMCGFGAMCDDPFIYMFVDEHKVLTIRCTTQDQPRIERLLKSFDLEQIEAPAGPAAAAHEHRSVLITPDEEPSLLAEDEVLEALRDEWRLILNIDPDTNLDDDGKPLGTTAWRCVTRISTPDTGTGPAPHRRYAEVLLYADSLSDAEELAADAVILASGGFEASEALRVKHMGPDWAQAKVRGTPMNTGDGLVMAAQAGAQEYGLFSGCHATPMDLHMADFGNLDLPHGERKNYRKICYFLGVMLNAKGQRFVDEGINFRNYTYAQFGRAVLEQPGHFAWQIFDSKVFDLLYGEYHFHDAHFVEADTLDALIPMLEGVDSAAAAHSLAAYNDAVDMDVPFDPTVLDGKGTRGLPLAKSNWAQRLDQGPFRAYPVTGGITFTYGGLRVSDAGAVLDTEGADIPGLFACGDLVGGGVYNGFPGGACLTSGAVFGRQAGAGAAA